MLNIASRRHSWLGQKLSLTYKMLCRIWLGHSLTMNYVNLQKRKEKEKSLVPKYGLGSYLNASLYIFLPI